VIGTPGGNGRHPARGGSWRGRHRSAAGFRTVAVLAVAPLAACASSRQPSPPQAPAAVAVGWTEEGLASWYGEPYHGRPTASGSRYDMHEMTAAHRWLPFGTELSVRHLRTGAEVTVVVNDRGPFVEGRILDLSRAAAERLGAVAEGVVPVRIQVLRPGDGMVGTSCWEVQVGAFARAENAARARRRLEEAGFAVRLSPAGGGLTRVRATGVGDRSAAVRAAGQLAAAFPGAVAVPCPPGVGGTP